MENEARRSTITARPQTTQVLGARVRALRRARGWTQIDLADRLSDLGVDLHQTTVAKLEAGSRPVSTDELYALASVLDVEYAQLMPAPALGHGESEALRAAQMVSELARAEQRLAEMRAEEAMEEASRARERAEEAKARAHQAIHRFLELNAEPGPHSRG